MAILGYWGRPVSRTACALLCALSISATSKGAPEGASTPERAKARALFTQGEKLFKAGDVDGAQQAFEDAYRTMPNATVLLKIADCQAKRNDVQAAVATLEKYLSERQNAPDRATVEDRIVDMRRTPGKVTLKSTPAGAAIWVDGKDSALVTPSDVEVPPGEHRFTLRLPPYQEVEQTAVVEFASQTNLEFTLPPPAPPPQRPPEGLPNTTSEPEVDHPPGRKLGAPFWIAVGVTAAGAAVTTAFGVIALDKHSQFERTPTNKIADDGERAATISDIALGVAAAGAVTATVLFFTAPRNEPRAARFSVTPLVGARSGGVFANASF
ncbi:MAG TPA: tetratricopeptide repeat protein [Polyangiaceae bacterium]|nr:tetratricopeptide repeat protein [Polyangiaceae bacterium]